MTEHRQKTLNKKMTTDEDSKKQFKRELLELFRKFGYLNEGKDYEVKLRTTSGSIAWININSIETIK
ncbi:MAG: hypothetical protein HZB61_00605 [Nitrospirae bacterium]|nr:hypothetical protein [Nitrospirota bacterium]